MMRFHVSVIFINSMHRNTLTNIASKSNASHESAEVTKYEVTEHGVTKYKALLNHSSYKLRFPADVEKNYQSHLFDTFYQTSKLLIMVGLPIYISFLFVDYFFYAEQFADIAMHRIFVIIFLSYLAYMTIKRKSFPVSPITAFLCGLVLCCIQVVVSSFVFEAPIDLIYAIGLVAIYVFAIIVLRVSFLHTFLFCVAYVICVCVMAAVSYVNRDLPPLVEELYLDVFGPCILVMLSLSIMGLFIAYAIDKLTRRDWLNAQIIEMESQQLNVISNELKKLSETDDLTGLANRRIFDTTLKSVWQTAEVQHQSIAIAMIDVDWFKAYNDYYGHAQGDETLKQIANCMKQIADGFDCTIARYGGEEFILVMPNATSETLNLLGMKLKDAVVEMRIEHEASPLGFCSISIGIGHVFPHKTVQTALTVDKRIAKMVKIIDDSLYAAKAQGKNCVVTATLD